MARYEHLPIYKSKAGIEWSVTGNTYKTASAAALIQVV